MRLHFVVEGQTEETFVDICLKPHLSNFGVYADARCAMTSRNRVKTFRGGLVKYETVRRDISSWLKQDRGNDVFFTTMFDLYALPNDLGVFQFC